MHKIESSLQVMHKSEAVTAASAQDAEVEYQ